MSDITVARSLGVTDDEFRSVVGILGRSPSDPELAMYSVMWSEHCSYKSSRRHLRGLPVDAPWVVVGPGENAGVVDIGDGWYVALRIESHNHPSFVEPYQGAATGVGGILRDVFTMGARPVGLWNQIRFGELDDPHSRYLFAGVVAGIGGYGNAVGVPTLGGEVDFDDSYAGNPLVNVMCLGLLRHDRLVLGTAGPPGSVAVLLGASTGRDGIGGASVLASTGFDAEAADKRPSVQVGDPYEEKKLIEACLELYERDLVVGVQDLGAAGLSCAASEPAGRAGVGLDLDLDQVHRREDGMTAPELLMSESQERMMAFVDAGRVDAVLDVAERWEIDASVVGTVTPGGRLRVFHNGRQVADLPAASLADDAPVLDRPVNRPADLEALWASTSPPSEVPLVEALLTLLGHPSLGDKSWIYEQFDHMLFLNTVVGPGGDGSLLRVRDTSKGLAVSTDGNGRLCRLDPRRGAEALVYEAALNVAVVGARPLAIVDNLNFGNPERPEVMWQFTESLAGLGDACRALGVPIVGGNVSFYNETDGIDIHPTPVVGMLGLADPIPPRPSLASGQVIVEVGPPPSANLAGSAYQKIIQRTLAGRPSPVDHETGNLVVDLAVRLAADGLLLHDISQGGSLVAVAETVAAAGLGADVRYEDVADAFGEDPHRVLCFVPEERLGDVLEVVGAAGIDSVVRGAVTDDVCSVGGTTVPASTVRSVWRGALREEMG